MSLLKVEQLSVEFQDHTGIREAVRRISFTVEPGEFLGIVGESGSGKSTAMKAVMGIAPETARVVCKEIKLGQKDITPPVKTDRKARSRYEIEMNRVRGNEIAMIFQDPSAYLNPSLQIGTQLTETIRAHRQCGRKEAKERACDLLDIVGIRNFGKRIVQYPFELSGGMQQRVVIAIALACEPKLLIADEPTTALDVIIQGQILDLLKRISQETGTAMVLVTHDLGIAAALCSRMLVMKAGKIIETGDTQAIFRAPRQEYTKELIGQARELQQYVPSKKRGELLLRVKNVSKNYRNRRYWKSADRLEAVCNVSFEIKKGETFGLVGESGCGKTTLANMIAGISLPAAGTICYRGTPLVNLKGTRGKDIQMVFQHSNEALNPSFTAGQSIAEPLQPGTGIGRAERKEKVERMLALVGLTAADAEKYPYQFSGGQRQRIGIARALICDPQLVICDEPVSALDVTVQAQILKLLKEIQKKRELSYLFISHDLNVVKYMSQRIGVMYLGHMVEMGDTTDLYEDPWHPYTKELLAASVVPDPKKARRKKRAPVKETILTKEEGCPYASCCGYAMECCWKEQPKRYCFDDREVACFLYSEAHGRKRSPDYIMTAQI